MEQRVRLVESLFYQLEQAGEKFSQASGICCDSGCGKCCTYPDIAASPLEFLPWAFHLFLNGEAENTLTALSQTESSTCFIYQSLSLIDQGRCSNYQYRGLICRLFGYAANTDKYGKLRLSTCQTIKDGQTEKYLAANDAIRNGLEVPQFTEYYMQLNQIDFHLGNIVLPVNKALKMALEEVLRYYTYRTFPSSEQIFG